MSVVISPYVRKVLVCLALKRIDYVIDPIVPLYGDDESSRISPVRRVPVFIDESLTITDSRSLCEYRRVAIPEPILYPTTPARARARAGWKKMPIRAWGGVRFPLVGSERVIKRWVWGEEANQAVVSRALEIEAPQILDYLEHEYTGVSTFLYGELGIADIAVVSFLRNASVAGFAIDPARWPAMHALASRALQHPAFIALQKFEELALHTPLLAQRDALIAAGAPVSMQSHAVVAPRAGARAM
ncbi:MAG: glutathione S-transferase family protein [Haliea sp.]|nr:glutathione S-transferase family protein [Haliea sp.]